MQPLSLTLKGFRGIRDGLGRVVLTLDFERLVAGAELVAIAGANGRGKTTVMDNLHPYLTMPSRAALAGPGGFSYYDHVFLPENEKDLTWTHGRRHYRSQVVIRLNGRRRTEAFLFALANDGVWKPVILDDGTISDGKVDTYTRCIESICGSADTFFTSVFSAQGKRQLSAYRNAEIKTLLADLLGQEEIRTLGLKAAETARLLKAGLGAIRQERERLEEEAEGIEAERRRLDGAPAHVANSLVSRQTKQATLAQARTRHAQLLAERGLSQGVESRRAQLQGECQQVMLAGTRAIEALNVQEQTECRRLERLSQRIAQRLVQERARRQGLLSQRRQCLSLLAVAERVRWAQLRHPLAGRILSLRSDQLGEWRERAQRLVQCETSERFIEQKLSGIEREAGQAALKAEELARRLGLTGEVPCVGTDLQGECKLLNDAREAKSLVPSAQVTINRLAREKDAATKELKVLGAQRDELAGAPQAKALAERLVDRASARVARLTLLAERGAELARVREALATIDEELAMLGQETAEAETPEEMEERQQIASTRQAIAAEHESQAKHYRDTLNRLKELLASLPAPYDESSLVNAQTQVELALRGVEAAEQAHMAAVRDAEALGALIRQAQALACRRTQIESRIAKIESELSNWTLFAKCMSNDGLIALAIDDAGPTLSRLANDLLLACYGSRFTVSIQTLVETLKGEQKEGFDILVHDGESGESKSVGLMSGGERVWISYRARHEIHYAANRVMPSLVLNLKNDT
ncbi:AAA family ATPase, partial [Dechloromonas sp. CZR5]|uniref:AAA family ATPase n=1 Tax=Dechloromonas sp. CZR5 TaxID=2608630 RepID=UPI00168C0313